MGATAGVFTTVPSVLMASDSVPAAAGTIPLDIDAGSPGAAPAPCVVEVAQPCTATAGAELAGLRAIRAGGWPDPERSSVTPDVARVMCDSACMAACVAACMIASTFTERALACAASVAC
jgi:hypothetical protein